MVLTLKISVNDENTTWILLYHGNYVKDLIQPEMCEMDIFDHHKCDLNCKIK
jgi:hypothetical protein